MPQTIGSRAQVMHGNAKKTSGGLTKSQLKYNKQGKIVSKKASALAKKNNRLVKAGYVTRKGVFGISGGKMKGGGGVETFNVYIKEEGTMRNNWTPTKIIINDEKFDADGVINVIIGNSNYPLSIGNRNIQIEDIPDRSILSKKNRLDIMINSTPTHQVCFETPEKKTECKKLLESLPNKFQNKKNKNNQKKESNLKIRKEEQRIKQLPKYKAALDLIDNLIDQINNYMLHLKKEFGNSQYMNDETRSDLIGKLTDILEPLVDRIGKRGKLYDHSILYSNSVRSVRNILHMINEKEFEVLDEKNIRNMIDILDRRTTTMISIKEYCNTLLEGLKMYKQRLEALINPPQ